MNEVSELNICDVLCTWTKCTTSNHVIQKTENDSSPILSESRQSEEPLNKSNVLCLNEKEHETTKGKTFTCSNCYKEFTNRNSLRVHLRIHSGTKDYCCEHCGKLFSHNATLLGHLTKFHNFNKETAHICTICNKTFCRKNALKIHMATHVGFKPFSCKICSKSFSQKITRDIHILTHTGKYDYSCPKCSRKFPTRYKLNYHIKSHNMPEYHCLLCLKQFTNKNDLDYHCDLHNGTSENIEEQWKINKSKNAGVPVSNTTCKILADNTSFVQNSPVQSVLDKKLLCNFCGYNFIERRSLLQHIKMRHSVVPAVRYNCNMCQKSFSQKSKLVFHMKRHTEVYV